MRTYWLMLDKLDTSSRRVNLDPADLNNYISELTITKKIKSLAPSSVVVPIYSVNVEGSHGLPKT